MVKLATQLAQHVAKMRDTLDALIDQGPVNVDALIRLQLRADLPQRAFWQELDPIIAEDLRSRDQLVDALVEQIDLNVDDIVHHDLQLASLHHLAHRYLLVGRAAERLQGLGVHVDDLRALLDGCIPCPHSEPPVLATPLASPRTSATGVPSRLFKYYMRYLQPAVDAFRFAPALKNFQKILASVPDQADPEAAAGWPHGTMYASYLRAFLDDQGYHSVGMDVELHGRLLQAGADADEGVQFLIQKLETHQAALAADNVDAHLIVIGKALWHLGVLGSTLDNAPAIKTAVRRHIRRLECHETPEYAESDPHPNLPAYSR